MKRSILELDEITSISKKLKASMVTDSPSAQQQTNTKKRVFTDNIDFSSLKRHRVFDPEQISDMDPILIRIGGWLREQEERQALPKTFTKLVRSISSMCRIKVQVDPTVVFYHLLFNNVIVIEKLDEQGGFVYKANPETLNGEFIGIVPDMGEDTSVFPFSEDFIKALKRTTNWVLSNRGLHTFKTNEGLLKNMAQLCTFKKELSPSQVVEGLKRKGYIYSGENADEVYYSLPQKSSSGAVPKVHYPAEYIRILEVMAE